MFLFFFLTLESAHLTLTVQRLLINLPPTRTHLAPPKPPLHRNLMTDLIKITSLL